MNKTLLLRFGDLSLKGKNKPFFIKNLKEALKFKLKNLNVTIDGRHDRIYVIINDNNLDQVIEKVMMIPGFSSYSIVHQTQKDLQMIADLAVEVMKTEIHGPITFKIETKRADKRFAGTSLSISQALSKLILPHFEGIKVDMKHPSYLLEVEIRDDAAYLYTSKHPAMGGFPPAIGGKALLMMSGGIDSPVAGYLLMKQGVEVELLHFESTPLTPLESVQKVIDLAKELAKYTKFDRIKLHIVSFIAIHESILKGIFDPYIITIMRRMMYQIAERFALSKKISVLANGESIGQVASQTLKSIRVVENVTNLPILRPLITFDKQDIINLAKRIKTYEPSIRPFNDCCSIYVPKSPVINPSLKDTLFYESKVDFEQLLIEAIKGIKTIIVTPETNLDLNAYGLDATEAITEYLRGL